MSSYVKLIYTETTCFGENKRTQKITKKYREIHSPMRYQSHYIKFSRLTPQKIDRASRVFFGGSHGIK